MSNIESVSTMEPNREFYSTCTKYFDALRKLGKTDNSFEDEFFFTMPAISGKI